ncbi:MAG TPA: hypothetical protein VMJ93_14240 [Verrucomicrobiae bacterium]|nr:hypothetical protein [Verrucomicrobiae bacterium]
MEDLGRWARKHADPGGATVTGTLIDLIALFLLLAAAVACALAPIVTFAWIFWSWKRKEVGLRRAREFHPQ